MSNKGADLRATEQSVDTRSAAGKSFLDMLGACDVSVPANSRLHQRLMFASLVAREWAKLY